MKPLAATFRKDGFDWSLVERQGDIAIYRQSGERIGWSYFTLEGAREKMAEELANLEKKP